MIIVATESNNVYALDALDGSVIWERNVGPPVSAGDLVCTKFDPMGIIGTPIVDLAFTRALFGRDNHTRWRRDHKTSHHFP